MMPTEVLAWTSGKERMDIAKPFGVTSRQAIYDLIYGKVKKPRQALLNAIRAQAEANKAKAMQQQQTQANGQN